MLRPGRSGTFWIADSFNALQITSRLTHRRGPLLPIGLKPSSDVAKRSGSGGLGNESLLHLAQRGGGRIEVDRTQRMPDEVGAAFRP